MWLQVPISLWIQPAYNRLAVLDTELQAVHKAALLCSIPPVQNHALLSDIQGLDCLKLTLNCSSTAGNKRWNRNLSADSFARPHSAAVAQGPALPANPAVCPESAQASGSGQAGAHNRSHQGASSSSVEPSPGMPLSPDDVVLTFTIHRYNR